MASNNNPTGVNQHKNCPPKGDEMLNDHLKHYYSRGVTNRKVIRELLRADHKIEISLKDRH
ncbi:hypothetical protein H0H92_010072 [Tricholoma furcatifolium]|nr:hypothetical protein H0H92_010072 [Tricholoma furcatifolium]